MERNCSGVLRRVSFFTRSVYIVALLFTAGCWSLINSGITGSALLFLLTSTTLTALLLGQKSGVIVMSLSFLAILGFAAGYSTGQIIPRVSRISENQTSILDWVNFGAHFLATAGLMMAGYTTIQSGLQSNIHQRQSLTIETLEKQAALERDFKERSNNLERRLIQIKVVSLINHTISTSEYSIKSLQSLVDMIAESLNLYYAGVFLIDPARQYAVLRAGSGAAGRNMLADGHRLPIGGLSMIGWCIANQQARISLNVQNESTRYSNPNLPDTQSELALPIIGPSRILGAMTIQSTDPDAFDDIDVSILQSISDSIGIAIENADLLEKSRRDLQEISLLNRNLVQSAWKEELSIHGKLEYQYTNPIISTSKHIGNHKFQFPIVLRGQTIGNMTIKGLHSPSPEDSNFIESVLSQMAISLESARLLEETQRYAAQQEKVNLLSTKLTKAPRIEDILQIAVRELGQLPSVGEVSIQLATAEETIAQESIKARKDINQ